MKLIIWFSGLCALINERLNFLQLTVVSGLKPWRVMEDELRVAREGEGAINVVDAALISSKVRSSILVPELNERITAEVVSSWFAVRGKSKASSRTGWGTHQIHSFVIDARVLGCIANSLQQCCLASIGPTDDENTKVAVFLTNVEGVEEVGHVNSR